MRRPDTPTGVTAAVNGSKSVAVSWTPSVYDGGSPVEGYTVTASPGGMTAAVGAHATSATLSGLAAGTPYTFTVKATNSAGDSAESEPSPQVVAATRPDPPTRVTAAVNGSMAVTISWTPPDYDGGSPVGRNGLADTRLGSPEHGWFATNGDSSAASPAVLHGSDLCAAGQRLRADQVILPRRGK